jgi:hypothetical protein
MPSVRERHAGRRKTYETGLEIDMKLANDEGDAFDQVACSVTMCLTPCLSQGM